ncbi:MAG: heavy metal-binding domain-containing protein [Pedobacter sp.]|jgi:Cu(I)/Ag(I) efflux system membrane fusion protein
MRKLVNTIAVTVILFLAACSSSEKPAAVGTDTISTQKTASAYTCPMHPEIISDKPGTCSICKMNLVEKTDGAGSTDSTVMDSSSHDGHQH